ncbi:hypothetical protein PhaeoP30_03694 (plasmid) [Phaeobacter inhibens]|nr:hypothetical protein PhaeoP30_03694 [Phaeobacter inhibens]
MSNAAHGANGSEAQSTDFESGRGYSNERLYQPQFCSILRSHNCGFVLLGQFSNRNFGQTSRNQPTLTKENRYSSPLQHCLTHQRERAHRYCSLKAYSAFKLCFAHNAFCQGPGFRQDDGFRLQVLEAQNVTFGERRRRQKVCRVLVFCTITRSQSSECGGSVIRPTSACRSRNRLIAAVQP